MYHCGSCCHEESRLHNEKSFAVLHWLDIKSHILCEGSDAEYLWSLVVKTTTRRRANVGRFQICFGTSKSQMRTVKEMPY